MQPTRENKTYTLTFYEVCELLSKSRKTVSRYIRQGRLHPETIKSKAGTKEFRFNLEEVGALKENKTEDINEEKVETPKPEVKEDRTGQDKTGSSDEVIAILRETQAMLKDQLHKKDEQIDRLNKTTDSLIERNRETNLLIGNLQHQISLLKLPEAKKPKGEVVEVKDKPKQKVGFFKKLFRK